MYFHLRGGTGGITVYFFIVTNTFSLSFRINHLFLVCVCVVGGGRGAGGAERQREGGIL